MAVPSHVLIALHSGPSISRCNVLLNGTMYVDVTFVPRPQSKNVLRWIIKYLYIMILLLNVVAVEYTWGFCSRRLQNTRVTSNREVMQWTKAIVQYRYSEVPNTFHTPKAVTVRTASSLTLTSCTNVKHSEAVSHCRNECCESKLLSTPHPPRVSSSDCEMYVVRLLHDLTLCISFDWDPLSTKRKPGEKEEKNTWLRRKGERFCFFSEKKRKCNND